MTLLTRRKLLAGAAVGSFVPLHGAYAGQALRIGDLNAEEDGVTDLARQLDGTQIETFGYMTPPLPGGNAFLINLSFFVMAGEPMATCPACETPDEFPGNILLVVTEGPFRPIPFWKMITTTGTLRVGEYVDPDTSYLTLLRLENADWREA